MSLFESFIEDQLLATELKQTLTGTPSVGLIGYQVTVVREQSNLRTKLGDMLGKAILTLFGNRIADEKQGAMV